MTPLIRITPSNFEIPLDDGGHLTQEQRMHMDDSDRIGSLFATESHIPETGGAGMVIGATVRKIDLDNNPLGSPTYRIYGTFSKRMGLASDWAYLLMSILKNDSFAFAIFSLEDFGFTDPDILEYATVNDLTNRAEEMGLKTCPHGLVAALSLSQLSVNRHSTIAIINDPVCCGDGLYYLSLTGRSDGTVIDRVIAYKDCRINAMLESGIIFGSREKGLKIPTLNKLGFMYVVPPNFILPNHIKSDTSAKLNQLATVTSLQQIENDSSSTFPFLNIYTKDFISIGN